MLPLWTFAKVEANDALSALSGIYEFSYAVKALLGSLLLHRFRNLAYEIFLPDEINTSPEKEAIGGKTVAAGAACFLVVLLDTLRESKMNDGAHGGLVDSQAEGHGADQNTHFVGHPLFLVFAAGAAFHLAVVADGGDAVLFEEIDGFSHADDRGRIDDDAAVRDLPHGAKEEFVLRSGIGLADDVAEVRTAETSDVFVRITEAELLDDVAANALRGAGGEGGDGAVRKNLAQTAELAVLRAEFMAPLGNAVGLVDGEKGNGEALQPVHRAAERNALRRQIEQLVFAGGGLLEDMGALVRGSGGVQAGSGNAHLEELRDLVLHQGDEWGDEDGDAGVEHGGKLVAERFAAAGRHYDASVAAGGEAAHDGFLAGAKGFVAPVSVQGFVEEGVVVGGRGFVAESRCEGRCGSHEELRGPIEDGRDNVRFCFAMCQVQIWAFWERPKRTRNPQARRSRADRFGAAPGVLISSNGSQVAAPISGCHNSTSKYGFVIRTMHQGLRSTRRRLRGFYGIAR